METFSAHQLVDLGRIVDHTLRDDGVVDVHLNGEPSVYHVAREDWDRILHLAKHEGLDVRQGFLMLHDRGSLCERPSWVSENTLLGKGSIYQPLVNQAPETVDPPEIAADHYWKLGPVQMVDKPEDPWRHRSSGMMCATCMWYVPKIANTDEPPPLGRCRRHAPTMSGYPAAFPTDWCGDHKLDENKM